MSYKPEGFLEYIQEVAPGRSIYEITDLVNNRFGTSFTAKQIHAYKKNHKIRSGTDGRFKKGQKSWSKGKTWDEIMSKEGQEHSRATCFKRGNVPWNGNVPIGYRRKTDEGYWIEKVRTTGDTMWDRYEFCHRIIWERENGPIPDDSCVIFLDGDKDNLSIENLALITKDLNRELNYNRLRFNDAEIQKSAIILATVKKEVRKIGEKG